MGKWELRTISGKKAVSNEYIDILHILLRHSESDTDYNVVSTPIADAVTITGRWPCSPLLL
jgi:hypothetical protein